MTTALGDILWISVAAFVGFELALGANYFLLKLVLRAMHVHAPTPNSGNIPPCRRSFYFWR